MQPELVKQSDLLNQVVLDRASMQQFGQIEVLWMYPKVHRVLGFICKSGWLGSKKTAFNLDQLDSIGADGVLVNSNPVDTDAEKVRQLESFVGCEVWTDAGERVGKVIDYLFDLQTGDIEQYLYVSDGWSGMVGSVYMLPSNYILRFGNGRVLVPGESISSFAIYRSGIQDKFSKVTDLFEERVQAAPDVRSLLQQTKEKARILAEQAKEKARSVAEQVVEEFDFEDEPESIANSSSEPDPWDDWELEDDKTEDHKVPVQKPTEAEPKTVAATQTESKSDVWDDDWI